MRAKTFKVPRLQKPRKATKRKPHQTLVQASRRVPAVEKAAYHQISGAGKSHVLRKFFGLSATDQAAIEDRVALFLDQAAKA